MADLKSELSKNLQRLILGLMMTPAEFDAKMMKKAMEVHKKFVTALWIQTKILFESQKSLFHHLSRSTLLLLFNFCVHLFTGGQ